MRIQKIIDYTVCGIPKKYSVLECVYQLKKRVVKHGRK